MLKYLNEDHILHQFNDINPSIIGHKIRCVFPNPDNDPAQEQGMYITVAGYEEQTDAIDNDTDFGLLRKNIRITTAKAEKFIMSADQQFSTNFPNYLTSRDKFTPHMTLAEYTYNDIGADIVGNSVMIRTGKDSNHSWGDFITGRVISFKISGAVAYRFIDRNSVMFEIKVGGFERPVVVDSYSKFWA